MCLDPTDFSKTWRIFFKERVMTEFSTIPLITSYCFGRIYIYAFNQLLTRKKERKRLLWS